MITQRQFVYLDNAATSWPKPASVIAAISDYYRSVGVAAGRSGSQRSAQVDRLVEQCRTGIAKLINGQDGQIVFCFNGTDGLNMAISGMIRPGDHVVMTDIEHNSVTRPINEHTQSGLIDFDLVQSSQGVLEPASFSSAITDSTRLVCVSHVSNVTGIEQDVASIVRVCRQANPDAFVLVDAAQSVGHTPVDVAALGCDILVAAGHKGLLGPLGTGFVYLSPRAAEEIRAVRFGGTGTNSESVLQPKSLPERLESGNSNVGGIAGLLAGLRFVTDEGVDTIAAKERALARELTDALADMEEVDLYGCLEANRTGVVSFNVRNNDPQTVAAILDGEFGIQVRAGYHCSPLMHRSLGSDAVGGSLRASVGVFNTHQHITQLVNAIQTLVGQLV